MQVTILGCGWSGGVPVVGNEWGACDPANPRNRRTRPSILVEEGGTTLLIDTSPDLREQLLRENVQRIDAVLYTHAHADHAHGIDDLRSMNWRMNAAIPIYGDAATIHSITRRFDYIFRQRAEEPEKFYKPALIPHIIALPYPAVLTIGALTITVFAQDHVHMQTLGFRIGNFAYSTDVKNMPEESFRALEGIDTWVVDCIREKPHPTHSHLAQTLDWVERIKPRQAYLTHMGINLDYNSLIKALPANVQPAYDGLVFSV
jgi:phosphoribosyl 1,2-cyclic phosphate phosphodiesterase